MSKRNFNFRDAKSDKFWNIEVLDADTLVTYGRTGTSGQTQQKTHADNAAARAVADKLVAEKLKKGYAETTSDAASGVASSAIVQTAKVSPIEAASPKATPKSAAKTSPESVPAEAAHMPSEMTAPDPAAPLDRTLHLEKTDYLWATWRPRTPLSQPEGIAKPFDFDAAVKKLTELASKNKHAWQSWNLSKAKLAPVMSRQEAHFWLISFTQPRSRQAASGKWMAFSVADIESRMKLYAFDGTLSTEKAVELLANKPPIYNSVEPEIVLLLVNLFAPLDAVEVLLRVDDESRAQNKSNQRYHDLSFVQSCVEGFRLHILPYLSESEAETLRERLRGEIDVASWPSNFYEPPKMAFHLSALLGLSEELSAVVKSWKDDLYTGEAWNDHYYRPQEIVFGLNSGDAVSAEMRRLKLKLKTSAHIRAWLAHTEFADLDWARESVMNPTSTDYRESSKDVGDKLVQTLALAVAPEVAPPMLQLMLEAKAPRPAREWLDAHPAHTASGLASVAGGRGKLAEAAVDWLRTLKKRGFEAHIRHAADALPEEARARVEAQVLAYTEKYLQPFTEAELPTAIREAIEADKTLKLSKSNWIGVADLPPITFGERKLDDSHIEALLSALQKSKPDAVRPLVSAVKQSADRAGLDKWVWRLFERWLSESAPSKEKWAMLSVGYLGGDACALKMTPLIRAWPGQSQHQRAVTGLECLRAIGSDTALMQINGIAQKVKFKGLQAKAIECMEGIAQDRGLSRAQLEDRVVPDCDLDEKGTRFFDFGPRRWKFILGADMKPLLREEGVSLSKPRPDLPKPGAKDDAEKASAAVAEWKLVKKQIAEVAKIQAVRLEQAMVKGRLWTMDEFETLLVRHPLMVNLSRLLVWEAASGNRRTTFRVTEDGTYADANDEVFDLQSGEWAHIGIVHPLHVSDEEKRLWGELLTDYEIVPPFPQLGRAIHTLEGEEAGGKEITRFKEIAIPPQTVCFGLEKLGWERGPALDGGGFYEHYKQFESSGMTACAVYDPGLFMGGQEYWEPQKIVEAYFVTGLLSSREGRWNYPEKTHALPLADVDPVAISETLKDLFEIASKGKV